MDKENKDRVIMLMQRDLDQAPKGFADSVIMTKNGREWTPNQLMLEVKNGTDFGNQYAQMFHNNDEYMRKIFGEKYDEEEDFYTDASIN